VTREKPVQFQAPKQTGENVQKYAENIPKVL
jgi:hypothetical protein